MRVAGAGHGVFAVTLIGLGILGLTPAGFAAIWQPALEGLPAQALLSRLCALISLASGLGLLWRPTAAPAARVLLASLLPWLAYKVHLILRAPGQEGSYQDWGESAAITAGAWVLYAGLATHRDRRWLGLATGVGGLRIARALYALALVAFGLSHFVYLQLTAPLVPGWLPWHVAWAYFTGGAYLAAGLAMLSGMYARLAAVLVALQMALITLLVWPPMAAAGSMSAFNWGELVLSWVITAAGWVVADSYQLPGGAAAAAPVRRAGPSSGSPSSRRTAT